MVCLNQVSSWQITAAPVNPKSFGGRLEELLKNFFWWSNGMTMPCIFDVQTFTAWRAEPRFMESVCLLLGSTGSKPCKKVCYIIERSLLPSLLVCLVVCTVGIERKPQPWTFELIEQCHIGKTAGGRNLLSSYRTKAEILCTLSPVFRAL